MNARAGAKRSLILPVRLFSALARAMEYPTTFKNDGKARK